MHKILFILLLCISTNALAESLKQTVSKTLINNPSIFSKIENQKAFEKYIDDRVADYLPTLDVETYLESSELNNDRTSDLTDGQWTRQNGYNAAIVFRQYLYDGGLTSSRLSEARSLALSNKYSNLNDVENTILETIKVYNRLVLAEEKIILTKNMIRVNEENLVTAKENEQISGEVLETHQVGSKLYFVTDTLHQDQDFENEALADYERYTGSKLQGRVCRPKIEEKNIPENLAESIKQGVLSNFRIKEQISKIREQREKIAQANANFLPQIDIELKASIDEDLILSEDGTSKNNYARLNLNWNLYNGNRDYVKSEQERLFLNEQKKILDDITNEITAEIKSLFGKHDYFRKRVDALKKYVDANVNIADIYNEQFNAGTRTFIDILNAQSELYQSTRTLLDMEFSYLNNYYDLMFAFSKLSDVVLQSPSQDCESQKPKVTEYIPEKKETTSDSEIDDLLDDMSGAIGDELIDKNINNSNREINSTKNEEKVEQEIITPTNTQEVFNEKVEKKSNDEIKIEAVKEEENFKFLEEIQRRLDEPSNIDIESLKKELQINQRTDNQKINISLGIKKLLKSEEEYYTINLATLEKSIDGVNFIQENNIVKDAIMFEFGKDKKYVKVLYGVYKNYDDAKEGISKLNSNLVRNKPYIKKVDKYKKLFEKYN